MKTYSSYFSNRILKHVANDMKELASDGFTGVVHTFSENDFRYYSQSFIDIAKASHDAGLDVDIDPWGVGRVFGGEAFSAWIAENPDAMQVSIDGSHKPLACLNSDNFLSFMRKWLDAAVQTGTDGIFWDEPHLYIPKRNDPESSWTCACDKCRKLFSEMFNTDFPDTRTSQVEQFHAWTLKNFLARMLKLGKDAGMRNTVCLLPKEFAPNDPLDWSDIASLDTVDIIATDPYWLIAKRDVEDFVRTYSRRIKELADLNNIEPQIWIQAFRVPSGRENELSRAVEIAVEEGIENLAVWGFNACADMSYLRCDNSELVWDIVKKAFNNIKK
jgi:hypothetical protein